MKVALLITLMLALVLVHGQNPYPCMSNWNNNAYNNFLHRHILRWSFNRNSKQEWRSYLQQNNLCNRRRQTFMESGDQFYVERICQGHGWRDHSHGNLCISNSPIRIYDLSVDNNCQIQKLDITSKHVVVACDVIDNVCRPVHYERSTRFSPNQRLGRCQHVVPWFDHDELLRFFNKR